MQRALILVAGGAALAWAGACGGQSVRDDARRDLSGSVNSTDAQNGPRNGEVESETAPIPPSSKPAGSNAKLQPSVDPTPTDAQSSPEPPSAASPFGAEPAPDEVEPIGSTACGVAAATVPEKDEAGASCETPTTECGGDVVGIWTVIDCPLALRGDVNVAGFGLGCTAARITSGSLHVSGTWIAGADGRVCDDTHTEGTQEFELPSTCFDVGIVASCETVARPLTSLGYDTVECIDNPATDGCTCTGTFDQHGGLAAISLDPIRTGSYSVMGEQLTIVDEGNESTYAHCVTDDTLVLTLSTVANVGQVQGAIVLRKW